MWCKRWVGLVLEAGMASDIVDIEMCIRVSVSNAEWEILRKFDKIQINPGVRSSCLAVIYMVGTAWPFPPVTSVSAIA